MKLYLILLLLFSIGCSTKYKKPQEFQGMLERYWDERSALFPLEATQQGDNRFNHIIPNDQTHEFRKKLFSFYKSYLKEAGMFKRSSLSVDDKLSLDIFRYEMKIQLQGMKYSYWMIPFHQFWGLPLTMAQLGSAESFQPFVSVADYDNWLGRVHDFTLWSDSAIENFRVGIKKEIVLPEKLVLKMIPQMQEMASAMGEKSLFYSPIKKFPKNFSKDEKKRLEDRYLKMIKEEIIPTYQKLADFLKNEYLPHARKTSGLAELKKGDKIYSYLVRSWTTTKLTPDEIYAVGQTEVVRISQEMEKIRKQVKFKGSLNQFFEHMKKDPKLMPYKKPQEVLQAFRDIYQKIKPKLSLMFGRTPKTPFEIRQTEEFRAATASAEYNQGSPDGTRPGIFYIPILDAKKFNITSGMESLFLHEAIPGHHYQISLQQENESIPKFRRFSWYGAYGEGWALYTESLGKELGLYTNPYQYMGALGDEMHRALRLVVDVGLHAKSMTREEAVKYMMEHEPISEEGAVAEVERYMAIPGQALSYKIGALKIAELRKEATLALGSKFKISDFHDEVLKDGCMPLAVLERKMKVWVNDQLKK